MSRRAVAVALVLALGALAGCTALLGGERTASPTDEAAVTPAPVPTTAVPYPPGVGERRVDAAALSSAHADALREYNYTLTVEQRVFDANGTIERVDRRRTVAVGGEEFTGGYERTVVTRVATRVTDDVAYWTNGTLFTTRLDVSQRDPYYGSSSAGEPILNVDGARRLNRTLEGLSFRVTDRFEGGVVLAGRGASASERFQTPAGVADPRNVSTTLRVRFDGVVTEWRLTYDAGLRGRSVSVVQRFAVTDVGTTTVDRPDWVEEALRDGSATPS